MRHVMTVGQREDLAKLLRETRQHLGLSQPKAAARAGISQPMLYVLERGHKVTPSESTLLKIAKGYELDAVELLRRAGYEGGGTEQRAEVWNQSRAELGRAALEGRKEGEDFSDATEGRTETRSRRAGLAVEEPWNAAPGVPIDMHTVLDWALGAIALDKEYSLSPGLKDASLPLQAKALVVRYYQDDRGRQLLSSAEMQELNRLIHDAGDGGR